MGGNIDWIILKNFLRNIHLFIILRENITHLVTLTCAECDGKSLLLEHRYKDFEENLKSDLTDVEAWEIFHKLSFEASIYRKKDGECVKIKEEFLKFGFDEDDIEELKSQMERCVEFFKKYELNQFTGLR